MPEVATAAPLTKLTEEEALFRHTVREFAEREVRPRVATMERAAALDPALFPKLFDLVSEDQSIVGDAKFYDLVRGKDDPPAKFSIVAEHVWLLEKVGAQDRFLVFGNNRAVPERWLNKYGDLVDGVSFLFISESGVLEQLR